MRAWMFSSVVSGRGPGKDGRQNLAECAHRSFDGNDVVARRPGACATASASSRLSCEVKRDGIITQRTRLGPSASTATAAESAESMPPESPSTTPGKRFLFT